MFFNMLDVAIVFLVLSCLFIGSLFSRSALDWYDKKTIKPPLTPANWVFTLVWSLIALSVILVLIMLHHSSLSVDRKMIYSVLFLINGLCTIAWPYFFFYKKQPKHAFYSNFILIAVLIALCFMLYIDLSIAAFILLPYLFWILYAQYLNYSFLTLNQE